MRTIYFLNRFKTASNLSAGLDSFKYIILNETADVNSIRELFARKGSCEEIDIKKIHQRSFSDLREEFIAFIGRLNASNASTFWWAYFISNKNPALVPLFYDISNFLVLNDVIKEGPDCLVVITDRKEVVRQLRKNPDSKSCAIRDMIYTRCGIIDSADKILPVSITLKFLRLIWRKLYIALSGCRAKIKIEPNRPYTVIRTIINENCFSRDSFYADTYFGDLPAYLYKKNTPLLIVATLSGRYERVLKMAMNSRSNIPIIPIESLLTLSQAFSLFIISVMRFFKSHGLKDGTRLYGVGIRWLLENSMRKNVASSAFFSHADSYFSTETLMKKANVTKLLYPMENRPWERMMILSSRLFNPACRIIGYQHASIGQKHMNFVISDEEASVLPVPDEIIATGQAAKAVMEEKCNMRRMPIRCGCALRYSYREGGIRTRPKVISNVLVTLAASLEEYREALLFMERALSGKGAYNIRVRPHPVIPITPIMGNLKNTGFKFEISEEIGLNDDLNWCDIVLYVSATVSMEALRFGIPVAYLDVDPFLNRDPLYDLSSLKWTARSPADVIGIFRSIEGMNDDDYRRRQMDAIQYVKGYFSPVTEERMCSFV